MPGGLKFEAQSQEWGGVLEERAARGEGQ